LKTVTISAQIKWVINRRKL